MTAWLEHLETFDIFFSAPLDLDFLMLQSFPDEYHATAVNGGGPQIPQAAPAYANRIQRACRAVLKPEGGDGATYTDEGGSMNSSGIRISSSAVGNHPPICCAESTRRRRDGIRRARSPRPVDPACRTKD